MRKGGNPPRIKEARTLREAQRPTEAESHRRTEEGATSRKPFILLNNSTPVSSSALVMMVGFISLLPHPFFFEWVFFFVVGGAEEEIKTSWSNAYGGTNS